MKKTLYFSDVKSFKRHLDCYGLSDNKPYVVEGDDCLTLEVYNSVYRPINTLNGIEKELEDYRIKLADANGEHSAVVKNFDILLQTVKGISTDKYQGAVDISSLDFNYRITRHANGSHDILLNVWALSLEPMQND